MLTETCVCGNTIALPRYGSIWEHIDGPTEGATRCPIAYAKPAPKPPTAPRSCRVCGCTEADCTGCIERTGAPCAWAERDLCTACAERRGVEVSIRDLVTGDLLEARDIENDYMLVVAGNRYLHSTQAHANGTHVLTVRRDA